MPANKHARSLNHPSLAGHSKRHGVFLNSTGVELVVVVVGANQHQGFGITSSHDPGYQLPHLDPNAFSSGHDAEVSLTYRILLTKI